MLDLFQQRATSNCVAHDVAKVEGLGMWDQQRSFAPVTPTEPNPMKPHALTHRCHACAHWVVFPIWASQRVFMIFGVVLDVLLSSKLGPNPP